MIFDFYGASHNAGALIFIEDYFYIYKKITIKPLTSALRFLLEAASLWWNEGAKLSFHFNDIHLHFRPNRHAR